jgi:hypothetical protein
MLRKISVIAQSNGTDAISSPNVGEALRTSPSVCLASLRILPPTPQLCALRDLRAERRAQIHFDLVRTGRSRSAYGVAPIAHEQMTHDHGCRRRGRSTDHFEKRRQIAVPIRPSRRAVKGNPHSEDRQESAGPPKAAEGCKFRLLQPHDVQQPNGRQQGKQKQTAREVKPGPH